MNKNILLAVSMIKGMGRKTIKKFIDKYGIDENMAQLIEDLASFAKTNKRIKVPSKQEFQILVDQAERILQEQEKMGIVAIALNEEFYPKKMLYTDDPPIMIFAKGNLELLMSKQKVIAIIGTREITDRGKKVAYRFGSVMAQEDIIVVSGLAKGCDTYGHLGCVEAKGKTIAVLPSPIDSIYPASNRDLANKILEEGGLLLSEYYMGQDIRAGYFVDRDRIQAGLSDGVIVVETDVEGGTMHTVDFTIKYKRKLACYYDEENYVGLSQMNGNRLLVKEKKAIALEDKHDLKNLIVSIEEKTAEETIINQEEQISIFE